MYVDVKMNGVATQALVDTGDSHNFVTIEEAKRLGLNVKREGGSLKTVNSATKLIHGITKRVHTTIEEWDISIDLSVVPMDDF